VSRISAAYLCFDIRIGTTNPEPVIALNEKTSDIKDHREKVNLSFLLAHELLKQGNDANVGAIDGTLFLEKVYILCVNLSFVTRTMSPEYTVTLNEAA
jgi:hypothetical protein